MKRMSRWLGIMMSAMIAAGSLQAPVYAVEAGATATEAEVETDSIESVGTAEAEEPETDSVDEESAVEDSVDEATQEESVPEDVDTVEDTKDIPTDSESDILAEEPETLTEDDSTDQDASYIDEIVPQESVTENAPENDQMSEQVREFQDKVKIWKYGNQITIVYDSVEEIRLEYSLYSDNTNELLYTGNIQWDEQKSLYYEDIDFDSRNEQGEYAYDMVNIEDTSLRVVLDNGETEFEEVVSDDIGDVEIQSMDSEADGQIHIEWNTKEKVDGACVIIHGTDADSVISVYDVTRNESVLDNEKDEIGSIQITPYIYYEDRRLRNARSRIITAFF